MVFYKLNKKAFHSLGCEGKKKVNLWIKRFICEDGETSCSRKGMSLRLRLRQSNHLGAKREEQEQTSEDLAAGKKERAEHILIRGTGCSGGEPAKAQRLKRLWLLWVWQPDLQRLLKLLYCRGVSNAKNMIRWNRKRNSVLCHIPQWVPLLHQDALKHKLTLKVVIDLQHSISIVIPPDILICNMKSPSSKTAIFNTSSDAKTKLVWVLNLLV